MIHSTRFFVLSFLGLLGACSSADLDSSLDSDTGTGGSSTSGGSTSSLSGGSSSTGGSADGSGGALLGGSSSGGSETSSGGSETGGSSTGGATSGGSSSGGTGTGGTIDENGCPAELVGWAAVSGSGVSTTTGGGNATPTTVTTFAALKAAAQDKAPRVIVISGTIDTRDGGGSALEIASNKTLRGADDDATIVGGLTMKNVSNVIVRQLNVKGTWPGSGPDDTLSTRNSHHVWFDHLNVWDAGDGLLDITNASDYQTVSWCKFWYTNADHDHRLASLNGSGGGDHPEDEGKMRVTYHHNWWAELVDQRMPRVMYGDGHQFNNYFHSTGNSYCIGVGSYGSVLIENNYFEDVNNPHQFMYALWSHVTARGNVYDGTKGKKDTGYGGNAGDYKPAAFTDPPYDYTLDDADDVPELVTRCAGPQ